MSQNGVINMHELSLSKLEDLRNDLNYYSHQAQAIANSIARISEEIHELISEMCEPVVHS